ncbi:MAG: RNA polymerase sigma factor [Acidobacteria bacterium]|nr:RNA polymerase sigma factor [Acidobacteriota bacterium]
MPIASTATDAELVRLAGGGEGEAVRHLVERYSPRLHRYLRHLVGDAALADDLLQETWLRVVERLDRYNPARPFAAWLFAVARHCAIDALRQRARQARKLGRELEATESEEGAQLDPLAQIPAPGSSVLEQLAEADLQQRVEELFVRLPQHYREALALRFQEGLAFEEMARVLRVPLSTAKTRVQRGLVLLRQRVESLGMKA